jgi:hypothetical protein
LQEDLDDIETSLGGTPERAGPGFFAPEQMVRCDACLRANPPTRTACLYCGAALPIKEDGPALQRPTLRQLEKWEQGYNSIILPQEGRELSVEELSETASWLRLDAEELKSILGAREPLPLARTASPEEAALIDRRLGALGFRVLTVADKDLFEDEARPVRVRAAEINEHELVLHPTGGAVPASLNWTELTLLFTGRLRTSRVEVEERRKRGPERELVNASEMSADEQVLDIYTGHVGESFRIAANNFDYSSLGGRKRLVVAENFQELVRVFRERAPRAALDDSYGGVRRALAAVWRPEQRTEAGGLRHGGLGKFNTGSMTVTDNEAQLTRYSRLRRFLRLKHPELFR